MGLYRNIQIGLAVLGVGLGALPSAAQAALNIPLTVNMSEAVTVDTTGGTPRIAVDVGGNTRYATYTSGSGTSALTFTLTPTVGDVDLDGITVSSPINLNGGTIKDAVGNNATLTFTLPNTSGIKVDYPSLSMDFANSDYILSGTHYATLPSFLTAAGGSFTRASIGTYFDSSGVLQTAATDTPRFDYDPTTHTAKGLLLEESRTNSIPNSQATGFVTGVPGAIPASWSISANGTDNLTRQIVGTGTVNGINYVDIRWFGTTNSTGALVMDPMTTTAVAGASGQNWTSAAYIQVVAGSLPSGTTLDLFVIERTGAGAFLVSSGVSILETAPWQRYSVARTLNNASTAYAQEGIRIDSVTSGLTVDVTVRIGAPQFEQGAFATSYIPTTSAAVTRGSDNLNIPTGAWFNSAEGSQMMMADVTNSGPSARPAGLALHSTGNNGYLFYKQAATSSFYSFGGSTQVNLGSVTSNVPFLTSMGYTSSSARAALNGVLAASYTPASVVTPTSFSSQAGNWIGHLEKYRYYPLRTADTQLQLLTQ